MILTFRHTGLRVFFETGIKAGIQAHHRNKLERQLSRLDEAKEPEDMNVAGWRLHRLSGNLADHYSIVVNANWRLLFAFDGEDVVDVDYVDYH